MGTLNREPQEYSRNIIQISGPRIFLSFYYHILEVPRSGVPARAPPMQSQALPRQLGVGGWDEVHGPQRRGDEADAPVVPEKKVHLDV